MANGEQGQGGVAWQDGDLPVSTRFGDPYFSLDGGLAEARHVFLAGNDLPARFRPGFHLAELGLGTGLNLMATLIAWRASGCAAPLHYTTFEAYPLDVDTIARALAGFPEAAAVAAPFLTHWAAGRRDFNLDGVAVTVIEGDARETLPLWAGRADAWFLDGFSPDKNPELWSPEMMAQVARHTAPQGTFATYSAAGHIRRALLAAGFTAARHPGFGRKWHMSTGILT